MGLAFLLERTEGVNHSNRPKNNVGWPSYKSIFPPYKKPSRRTTFLVSTHKRRFIEHTKHIHFNITQCESLTCICFHLLSNLFWKYCPHNLADDEATKYGTITERILLISRCIFRFFNMLIMDSFYVPPVELFHTKQTKDSKSFPSSSIGKQPHWGSAFNANCSFTRCVHFVTSKFCTFKKNRFSLGWPHQKELCEECSTQLSIDGGDCCSKRLRLRTSTRFRIYQPQGIFYCRSRRQRKSICLHWNLSTQLLRFRLTHLHDGEFTLKQRPLSVNSIQGLHSLNTTTETTSSWINFKFIFGWENSKTWTPIICENDWRNKCS